MEILTYRQICARIVRRQKARLNTVHQPKGENVNERRFNRSILAGRGHYEPCHILLTKKTKRRYTPDYLYETKDGTHSVFVEVKGDYKLGSEARARLAWEIAAERAPKTDTFVWARWDKVHHGYECELWRGKITLNKFCRTNADFEDLVKGESV